MSRGVKVEIVKLYIGNSEVDAKECNKCLTVKPLHDYFRKKNGAGGRASACKVCSSIQVKQYYIQNPKKGKERHKNYYLNNTEKCKKASKKWINSNPLKLAAIQHRKRAKSLGLPATIKSEQLGEILERFDGRCALTGSTEDIVWDHFITLSTNCGGSMVSNMIPLNSKINRSKGDSDPFKWFEEKSEKHNMSKEKFNTLIKYLSAENEMSVAEYINYVNDCYESKGVTK